MAGRAWLTMFAFGCTRIDGLLGRSWRARKSRIAATDPKKPSVGLVLNGAGGWRAVFQLAA